MIWLMLNSVTQWSVSELNYHFILDMIIWTVFLIRSTDLLKKFDSEEWLNSVASHSKPLNDFSSLKYSTQVKLTIFIYLFVYLSYAKNSLKLNEIPSVLTETWVNTWTKNVDWFRLV